MAPLWHGLGHDGTKESRREAARRAASSRSTRRGRSAARYRRCCLQALRFRPVGGGEPLGEIVGARYAEVSAPESIRFPTGKKSDGTLTLSVMGAHAPMMQHVAPAIMERVNQFFGYAAVARIVIRQGAIAAPRTRAAPPSLRPVPAELGDSLRNIADPELRECLSALAGAVAASNGPPLVGVRLNKGSND